MGTTIFLIVLALIFSAIFSGIEIAFLSANKLKIELSFQRGTLSGKILNDYIKNPSKFIVTTLLGNNIALIAFGILTAAVLEPVLEPLFEQYFESPKVLVLVTQTIISTTIILFFR
jgi:putative hemolysin